MVSTARIEQYICSFQACLFYVLVGGTRYRLYFARRFGCHCDLLRILHEGPKPRKKGSPELENMLWVAGASLGAILTPKTLMISLR